MVMASALVLALAGCGSDNGGAIDVPTGSSPSTTAAASAADSGGIDGLVGTTTTPVSTPPTTTRGLLSAVRASRHEGYDRVVFEFETAVPGYAVGYHQGELTEDGSGNPVAVAGGHILLVRMENAGGADLSGSTLRETYKGPPRITTNTPEVAELVRAGDFEGVLTWAIGVRDEVGFRVQVLSGPPRLVIDVRNH